MTRPNSARLVLSPLLLLVALLTTLGVNESSAAANAGPETRVRAIPTAETIAVGHHSGETAGGVGCLRPETTVLASATGVATNRLELGPASRANPWPAGNNGVAMPAPQGTRIELAMSPGQTRPGGFGTLDHIPDVDFARNNLAIRPDWKAEISHVQAFEVPPGVQIQVGPVGPQTLNGVTYPGGATQVEILNYSDRARLVPVGDPRPIK